MRYSWIIGAAFGLAAAYFTTRKAIALGSGWTSEDVEYLARVTMLEAATGSDDEQAAIMQVALNRAASKGQTVREIVSSIRWPGGGARGESFVEAVGSPAGTVTEYHRSPLDYPQYPGALALAGEVVSGRRPNRIGGRDHFVHPQSLSTCTTENAVDGSRICYRWASYGLRRTPVWAISESSGGESDNEPIQVGRAFFM